MPVKGSINKSPGQQQGSKRRSMNFGGWCFKFSTSTCKAQLSVCDEEAEVRGEDLPLLPGG